MLSVILRNSASSNIHYKQYKHRVVYFVSLMKKRMCEVFLCRHTLYMAALELFSFLIYNLLSPGSLSLPLRYHPGQSLSSLVLLETPHEGLFAPALPFSLFLTQQPEWAFLKKSHLLSLLFLKPCHGSPLLTVKFKVLTKPFMIHLHPSALQPLSCFSSFTPFQPHGLHAVPWTQQVSCALGPLLSLGLEQTPQWQPLGSVPLPWKPLLKSLFSVSPALDTLILHLSTHPCACDLP